MNTLASLKLKLNTVAKMEENRESLVESEIQDLTDLIQEMKDLANEYAAEIGAEIVDLTNKSTPETISHILILVQGES